MCDLAVIPLLARVREAWDGPLGAPQGPELSLDYPGPRLRRLCDLDLLTDDAPGAQAALLAAGFREARETRAGRGPPPVPARVAGAAAHGGAAQTAELGGRRPGADHGQVARERRSQPPRGRRGSHAPTRPARAGARGARLVAQTLGRLGNLIDVAVTLQRADESEVAALARRWGCWRMWRTTEAAICAVLEGRGRSAAVAPWARHLRDVREPTVVEWHVKRALAPVWGFPAQEGAGGGRAQALPRLAGEPRAVADKFTPGSAGGAERGHHPLGSLPRAGARGITIMEGTETG